MQLLLVPGFSGPCLQNSGQDSLCDLIMSSEISKTPNKIKDILNNDIFYDDIFKYAILWFIPVY